MTPEQIADIRARFAASAGTSDDTLAIVALLGEVERLQTLVAKIQVQVGYWFATDELTMKLTADMFIFSAYEYELCSGGAEAGAVVFDAHNCTWDTARIRTVGPCLTRTAKPRPALLPEGEEILCGDEWWDGGYKQWRRISTRVGGHARAGEVWRRMP